MRPIDFFIIGAQKSGTTTMYEMLAQSSDVFLPAIKENWYFANDQCYEEGEAFLEAPYSKCGAQKTIGSAYAHLMYFPSAAERIRSHNPAARFIAVLRNPVDRAYSAYWFARSNGWETAETFEKAIALEPQRMRGSYRERADLTYVDHGRYERQLRPYFEMFGKDRVRVILSEELKERPAEVASSLLAFLDCGGDVGQEDVALVANASRWPRSMRLQRFVFDRDNPLKRIARAVLGPGARVAIREAITPLVLKLNTREFRYPPLDERTRQRLVEEYADENRRLALLLGRPIPW